MTSSSTDPSRSSGAAYAAVVDQEKTKRDKGRSLRPLAKLWPFIKPYPGQLIALSDFPDFVRSGQFDNALDSQAHHRLRVRRKRQ